LLSTSSNNAFTGKPLVRHATKNTDLIKETVAVKTISTITTTEMTIQYVTDAEDIKTNVHATATIRMI
jgi:hypothetical protein